jgi:glycosyltransferase involved in cell wall biosynthesis
VTVRNGIEPAPPVPAAARERRRAELGLSEEDRVLVCVGRLSRAKGQRHLLRALALLAPQFPRLRCLLVGDGEERAALEALAQELSLGPALRFLGSRDDVPELLSLGRAFVLPSEWEGLPVALLEAMAAGLPCVATRVAGTAEVIREGSGLLVPPSDPAALAAAIRSLLLDPALAERMARQGAADVRARFLMPALCARYLALYRGEPLPADSESTSS